jgi:hypothetical protein
MCSAGQFGISIMAADFGSMLARSNVRDKPDVLPHRHPSV